MWEVLKQQRFLGERCLANVANALQSMLHFFCLAKFKASHAPLFIH